VKKVLIIDDDDSALFAYSRFLEDEGIETDTAESIAEGMEKLVQGSYGTVVLDMKLPDGTATDMIPEIRKHHPTAFIAVVSGMENPSTEQAVLEAGADHFLTKPLSMAELCKRVMKIVGKESDGQE
jgi:DNA-binding response OmpR family regulator